MYALLNVAFALLAGLLMTRIFSRWRLPDVTAFLVAGVLIGPFCLGRLGITGVGFAAYEDVANAIAAIDQMVTALYEPDGLNYTLYNAWKANPNVTLLALYRV